MIPSLPLDLLQMILENVKDKLSLAQCCRTSKVMLNAARPLLYRKAKIIVRDHTDFIFGREQDTPQVLVESLATLRMLERKPHLQILVRDIKLSTSSVHRDKRAFEEMGNSGFIFEEIIRILPKLQNVVLSNPIGLDLIDARLLHFQSKTSTVPSVHLVLKEGVNVYSLPNLASSYATLETGDSALAIDSPISTIFPGITSLKVHFTKDVWRQLSLSNFTNLERLEFYTVNPIPRRSYAGADDRPDRFETILDEFEQLTTLRTLILSGDSHSFALERLLTASRSLIERIPSSVTVLYVNMLDADWCLRRIVNDISDSSGIKTIRYRATRTDLTELEEECEEMKIRLCRA